MVKLSNSERLLKHWEEPKDVLRAGTITEAECRVMGMIFRRTFPPMIIKVGDTFELTWTFTVNDENKSTHVGTYTEESEGSIIDQLKERIFT